MIRKMSLFSKFIRHYTNLGERIYPGGTEGRSSFNGRVITVFGSYGNLGRPVVAELGKKGTQIVIPHRCTAHEILPLRLAGDLGQIHLVEFDPYDLDSIMNSIRYSDSVISLVGNSYYPSIAKRCNIDVPHLIAEAVSRSPNVKNFLHVSCLGQNHPNTDIVSKTKYYGEILVRKTVPNVITVRPSTMYCNPDNFICLIAVKRNAFYIPFYKLYGKVVKIPTSMNDVAHAISNIVLENKFHGKVFELYGNESYYMKDIYDFIHKIMRKMFGNIASFLQILPLRTMTKLFPNFMRNLNLLPPHFTVNDVISDDPRIYTYQDLGIEPINTEDGIRESICFIKDYADSIPFGEYTNVYEQPHLHLISKKIRDNHEKSLSFWTTHIDKIIN